MKLLNAIEQFKKTFLTLIASAVLSVILAACSSDGDKKAEYIDAASVEGLEIPPKLSVPDTQGALRLPKPSATANSNQGTQSAAVIAPQFSGFELKNDSRLYWLEIDMPVTEVWKNLPDFLTFEGIEVDRVERLLGYLDTSWMSEYKAIYNNESSSSWFDGFSADYKDRFRIRVEAILGSNKTRMFVSHRGLQLSTENDVQVWMQRETEPFLERDILYRYVLFNGISKTGATELLASYRTYQSRVNKVADSPDIFTVTGESDKIWMRLQIAMDRLGVDVVKSDKASRTMQVLVGDLDGVDEPSGDDSGWFAGLFSSKKTAVDEGDERKAIKSDAEERITLQLQQIVGNGASEIKLSNIDASELEGKSVWTFRNALLDQLK